MVLSTDDPGNTGSSLSSAGVREGLFDVCWCKDKWEPVMLLYLLTMFLCFWRCTTSATTSVIATSPVWRAKCLQISSWMNGREGPNPTWRTSPAPVPAYQSRWDCYASTFPHLGIPHHSFSVLLTSLASTGRTRHGCESQMNVPRLLWERRAPAACPRSAQQTTAVTQVCGQMAGLLDMSVRSQMLKMDPI